MTKPSEPAEHTPGGAPTGAEDPALGHALDAALHDARARRETPASPHGGGGGGDMVLGVVQADISQSHGADTRPVGGGAGPATIEDLDASLAEAAAQAA